MDYTNILNILMNYGSTVMLSLAVLVFVTNIIVEVIKTAFSRLPTSFLTIIVAIVVTILALFISSASMHFTVTWYLLVCAVVMGIFVAYAAMFGFDKFKDAWEKFKEYKNP